MAITGTCLCGDVQFALDGPLGPMVHCHCGMCRKAHGAAFATGVGVAPTDLRWVAGADAVRRRESSPGVVRAFCGRCGSVVPDPGARERVFVRAGLFDADPGIRPVAHIFAGSKAPWHDITDDLPRFEAFPPGYTAVAFARPTAAVAGAVRGSCLCGATAYEIAAPVAGPIVDCHCSRCRKARSAAHASNLFVDAPRFRWLRGDEQVVSYKVPEALRFTHAFCGACGSSVPRVDVARDRVVVPAGSLDDDPGSREELHIFVGSKAPWYDVRDGLPQHERYPPGVYPPPSHR